MRRARTCLRKGLGSKQKVRLHAVEVKVEFVRSIIMVVVWRVDVFLQICQNFCNYNGKEE